MRREVAWSAYLLPEAVLEELLELALHLGEALRHEAVVPAPGRTNQASRGIQTEYAGTFISQMKSEFKWTLSTERSGSVHEVSA